MPNAAGVSSINVSVQVAGDWLVYAADSSVIALDPTTGAERWRTFFRPPTVGLQTVDNVVRAAESINGTYDRITFLDAASGVRLFTTSELGEWSRRLVAASDSGLLFIVSDTGLLLRERGSGAVLWARTIPLPPCIPVQPVACYVAAGRSGPDLVLVRFNPGRTAHHLLRVTPDGAIAVAPFVTPAADSNIARLAAARLDATGETLFLTASGVTMALDARTGAERWRTMLSPPSGSFRSAAALAQYLTAGSDPQVQIIVQGYAVASVVMRELVVRLSDGVVVRERQFSVEPRFERAQRCGTDGVVLLLGGPGFTHTDARTGKMASGVVVESSAGTLSLESQAATVLTWPSGRMVVQPPNSGRLIGFRCALATP